MVIRKRLLAALCAVGMFGTIDIVPKAKFVNVISSPTIVYGARYKKISIVPTQQFCIAWDINGVILTKNVTAASLVGKAVFGGNCLKLTKQVIRLNKFKKKLNKERLAKQLPKYLLDEHFIHVAMRSEDQKVKQAIAFLRELIAAEDTVNDGVSQIINDLFACGCMQGVLSNIWDKNLEIQVKMIERKPKKYTHLKKLLTQQELHVIPGEKNQWKHKPEREAYALYLEKVISRGHGGAMTIFIDDKLENVQAAVDHGFDVAIHFVDHKQLRKDLVRLGVPIKVVSTVK